MNAIGAALIGVGGVGFILSHYLERYHNRRFREHIDALEAAQKRGDAAIGDEVREFHEDSRIDWAIEGMFWSQVVGITLISAGILLFLR